MQQLLDLFELASPWELVAVVLALAYVILAVKKNMWCWWAAVISSGIYVALMIESRLYMEAALNVFYVAMALYGYWAWQRGRDKTGEVSVVRWHASRHVAVGAVIAMLTLVNGWLLKHYTDAARPFLDSFITWASVVTTWMVARRVLENWLYWIVIDALAAVLYFQQARRPTAVLFVIYVIISINGYRVWSRRAVAPAIESAVPASAD
jgi:nicotinamide mononucleotide transporter